MTNNQIEVVYDYLMTSSSIKRGYFQVYYWLCGFMTLGDNAVKSGLLQQRWVRRCTF